MAEIRIFQSSSFMSPSSPNIILSIAPSSVESPVVSVTNPDSPPSVSEYTEPQDIGCPTATHCISVHDADVDLEEGTSSSLPSQPEFFHSVRQHVCAMHERGETALVHQEALEESHQDQGLNKGSHSEERAFGLTVDDAKPGQPGVESSGLEADVEKGGGSSIIKQVDVAEEEGQEGCCRICHLAVDRSPNAGDVIKLGCACKNDLAVTHRRCAETWFKIKGNRTCEICGSTAQNVFTNGDHYSADQWNEEANCLGPIPAERCWQNQPLCSKLLVCVLLVLFASWLFRVTLF